MSIDVVTGGDVAEAAEGREGVSLYTIDQAHSQVGFRVRHLGFNKVAGTFGDYSVTVALDPDNLATLEASLRVQTASVDTGNQKRDEHLRSADFFESEIFPEMTFRSTGIRTDGSDFEMVGDLMLHGVSREVTLKGEMLGRLIDPWGMERIAFEATTTINRKDFGLVWNQVLESGGLLVAEKVDVVIELQLVKSDEE